MIVDPDFPDHWKTRLLVELLGDEAAPVYLIRLWGHCQTRRKSVFDLTAQALRSICRYAGDPQALEAALADAKFVRRHKNGMLEIHEWDKYNATLVRNWRNGELGGRPKNPNGTQRKPKPNPDVTQQEPNGNPNETQIESGLSEKRREEKIGEEKKGDGARKRFQKPSIEEVTDYCRSRKNAVDPQRWLDHYESNGWKVGKNPMKDWRAAVRTWEKNGFSPAVAPSPPGKTLEDQVAEMKRRQMEMFDE